MVLHNDNKQNTSHVFLHSNIAIYIIRSKMWGNKENDIKSEHHQILYMF